MYCANNFLCARLQNKYIALVASHTCTACFSVDCLLSTANPDVQVSDTTGEEQSFKKPVT